MNRDRYRSVRQHRRVCVRGVFQSRVWRERVLSFFATASSGRCVVVVWPWRGRGVAVAWPWRGRGVAVVWPWCGRGVAVVWSLRDRGRCGVQSLSSP